MAAVSHNHFTGHWEAVVDGFSEEAPTTCCCSSCLTCELFITRDRAKLSRG